MGIPRKYILMVKNAYKGSMTIANQTGRLTKAYVASIHAPIEQGGVSQSGPLWLVSFCSNTLEETLTNICLYIPFLKWRFLWIEMLKEGPPLEKHSPVPMKQYGFQPGARTYPPGGSPCEWEVCYRRYVCINGLSILINSHGHGPKFRTPSQHPNPY